MASVTNNLKNNETSYNIDMGFIQEIRFIDYKQHGEDSYVYNNSDIWIELLSTYYLIMNDNAINAAVKNESLSVANDNDELGLSLSTYNLTKSAGINFESLTNYENLSKMIYNDVVNQSNIDKWNTLFTTTLKVGVDVFRRQMFASNEMVKYFFETPYSFTKAIHRYLETINEDNINTMAIHDSLVANAPRYYSNFKDEKAWNWGFHGFNSIRNGSKTDVTYYYICTLTVVDKTPGDIGALGVCKITTNLDDKPFVLFEGLVQGYGETSTVIQINRLCKDFKVELTGAEGNTDQTHLNDVNVTVTYQKYSLEE